MYSQRLDRYIWEMHQYNIYTDEKKEVEDGYKWKPKYEGHEPPF